MAGRRGRRARPQFKNTSLWRKERASIGQSADHCELQRESIDARHHGQERWFWGGIAILPHAAVGWCVLATRHRFNTSGGVLDLWALTRHRSIQGKPQEWQ